MTQTQIRAEFKNAGNLEEAKKIYKILAKQLHPDMGGSTEAMQDLQAVYTHLVENELFFSNESGFDIDIEKIVAKLLHLEDIVIDVVGSWIWVTGNTKQNKEKLMELGFKYASKKKAWHWAKKRSTRRSNKSLEEIKATYGYQEIRTQQKARLSA